MLRAGATQVHAPTHTDSINTNKVLKNFDHTDSDQFSGKFLAKDYELVANS